MPTEGPEGWKLGLPDQVMIVLDDLLCSAVDQEIDFKLSSESNVAECGCTIVVEPNDGNLGVGVSEEESNILLRFLSLYQEEGMNT